MTKALSIDGFSYYESVVKPQQVKDVTLLNDVLTVTKRDGTVTSTSFANVVVSKIQENQKQDHTLTVKDTDNNILGTFNNTEDKSIEIPLNHYTLTVKDTDDNLIGTFNNTENKTITLPSQSQGSLDIITQHIDMPYTLLDLGAEEFLGYDLTNEKDLELLRQSWMVDYISGTSPSDHLIYHSYNKWWANRVNIEKLSYNLYSFDFVKIFDNATMNFEKHINACNQSNADASKEVKHTPYVFLNNLTNKVGITFIDFYYYDNVSLSNISSYYVSLTLNQEQCFNDNSVVLYFKDLNATEFLEKYKQKCKDALDNIKGTYTAYAYNREIDLENFNYACIKYMDKDSTNSYSGSFSNASDHDFLIFKVEDFDLKINNKYTYDFSFYPFLFEVLEEYGIDIFNLDINDFEEEDPIVLGTTLNMTPKYLWDTTYTTKEELNKYINNYIDNYDFESVYINFNLENQWFRYTDHDGYYTIESSYTGTKVNDSFNYGIFEEGTYTYDNELQREDIQNTMATTSYLVQIPITNYYTVNVGVISKDRQTVKTFSSLKGGMIYDLDGYKGFTDTMPYKTIEYKINYGV